MKNVHNFCLVNADTDSIMFAKSDTTSFSKEERELLLEEINNILPEYIKFADDGYYTSTLVFKAKNYVLLKEDGKIKYKGSALKSSTLEEGCKRLIDDVVKALLYDKKEEILTIYQSYVKQVSNIKTQDEMKPWCSKKTLSETTYKSQRTNETNVIKAIQGTEYTLNDKIWVFFNQNDDLTLIEHFEGEYAIDRLLEKLYTTMKRFEDVIDFSIIKNYKLKKNKKELNEL